MMQPVDRRPPSRWPGAIVALLLLGVLVVGGREFMKRGAGTSIRVDADAAPTAPKRGKPIRGAARGSIAGVVRDAAGAPIYGAVVIAVGVAVPEAGGEVDVLPAARAITAADGRFELGDLRQGSYGLTATAAGFLPGRRGGLALRGGDHRSDIDLTL